MVLTVQPRASSQTDTPDSWIFLSIVNNWIRSSPLCWRVVEAERLMPNCYDPTFYVDTTHLTPLGYSNVAWAVQRQLFTPAYSPLSQEWINVYGTNNIVSVPGATNNPSTIGAFFTASGLFLPPNGNPWPGSALVPGACCFVNSNGTVYLLTSSPGSTTWAATNKLGGL